MSPDRLVRALVDAGDSSFMTDDLDVCFSRKRENLRRLVRALAPYHHPRLRDVPPDIPVVWDDATLRNSAVVGCR